MTTLDNEALVLHRLALARAAIIDKAPYVAETLLNLTPVVVSTPGITLGVTKHLVLYVGIDFVLHSQWVTTDAKMAGVVRHEVEHPLRGLDRLEAMPDPELANDAADRAINFDLREEGWELPECGIFPEEAGLPGGKHMEWYYDKLQQMCQEQNKSISQLRQDMKNGSGSGKGKGQKGKGAGTPDPLGVTEGVCGGVGGKAANAELEAELDSQYGKSDAEVEAIRRKTLEDIEDYIEQHGRGSVPGRFQELIKTKIKPPDVNWRQKLRQVVRRSASQVQAGGRDYSISRPSMTGMFTGALLSGLIDRPLSVAVVIDTSGSMGPEQLMDAGNETFHIAKKVTADKIWLLHVDVAIHRCERVRATQIPNIPFAGRGGTDFRDAFKKLVRLKPRPNLVVYITDGDGLAPLTPPKGMDVIWCVVRTPWARKPANWGHLVVCDKNQTLKDPVLPGIDD